MDFFNQPTYRVIAGLFFRKISISLTRKSAPNEKTTFKINAYETGTTFFSLNYPQHLRVRSNLFRIYSVCLCIQLKTSWLKRYINQWNEVIYFPMYLIRNVDQRICYVCYAEVEMCNAQQINLKRNQTSKYPKQHIQEISLSLNNGICQSKTFEACPFDCYAGHSLNPPPTRCECDVCIKSN